jgi:hypothetical protein
MNKKVLITAIAIATAATGTSALAATKLGGATQKGSVLIFPRVEANMGEVDAKGGTASDTYISITNDSSVPVNVQCYWATTEQGYNKISGGNASKGGDRSSIRNNHYMDFSFTLTKNQPAAFWAGSFSDAANGLASPTAPRLDKLVTTINAPQFNFFQDGSQSNAGELKCWAVDRTGTMEIHHNHLVGKATVYSFGPSAQAHEYNAWAFQANYWGDKAKKYEPNNIAYTGKALPTPGVISLDGKEYDQCPSQLLGQFIPTSRIGDPRPNTQISVANCHEDLRQDSQSHITKLTYTVWNANEVKYTGAHECMGAWYESDLGAVFPHFTYKTLKTDSAYFRAVPTKSALCNQGYQKGTPESDIGVDSVVGIQVNDISGSWESSSNLVGLGAGTTYSSDAVGKGEILWDHNNSGDVGKK